MALWEPWRGSVPEKKGCSDPQLLPASKTCSGLAHVTRKYEIAACNFHDGLQPLQPGLSLHLFSHHAAKKEVLQPKIQSGCQGVLFLHWQAEQDLVILAISFLRHHTRQSSLARSCLSHSEREGHSVSQTRAPWSEAMHAGGRCGNSCLPARRAGTAFVIEDDRGDITSPSGRATRLGCTESTLLVLYALRLKGPSEGITPPGHLVRPPWFCSHHCGTCVGGRYVQDGKLL